MTKNKIMVVMLVVMGMLLFAVPCPADVLPYPTVAVITPNATFEGLVVDGRTLVPLRPICESLGAEVSWQPIDQSIIIKKGGQYAILYLNKKGATINGTTMEIDTAPRLFGTTTYVPARVISEALGATVHWDGYRVHISTSGKASPPAVTPVPVPAEPIMLASAKKGYLDSDAPIHFKGVYALYPYNIHCGSTRLLYNNDCVPINYDTDIYIAADEESHDIVIENRESATLEAVKKLLSVYFPTEYENVYQEAVKVERPEQKFYGKIFDGKKVDCFIDGDLVIRVYI